MSPQWYYNLNGGAQGPVDTAEILRLIQSGLLTPEVMVCPVGGTEWSSAASLGCFQLSAAPAPPPPPVPQPPNLQPAMAAQGGLPVVGSQQKPAWIWWMIGGIGVVLLVGVAVLGVYVFSNKSDSPTQASTGGIGNEEEDPGFAEIPKGGSKPGKTGFQRPPTGWRPYMNRSAGFSALMPSGTAVVTGEPVPRIMVRSPAKTDGIVFQVHTIPLPPGESGLAPTAAQELKTGILSSFRAKRLQMLGDRVTYVNGHKVLELKFTYIEQGVRLRMHMHTFLTERKVFACTVIAAGTSPFPYDEEKSFVQSIRVLN